MTAIRILVTGATGKTGRYTVTQLAERGYKVRAMVRRHDQRSEELAGLGAEVVTGDFHSLASIRGALEGIDRAYFCYPPESGGLLEATTIFSQASRRAGVRGVVNMSQLTAREDAPSPLSFTHWLSENVLDNADIGAVHIRPGFFSENLYLFGAQTIAAEGKLYLPYGDQKHAPISSNDIARVVVALLEDPAPHSGQRYLLTGPELYSIDQIAEVFSGVLDRPVEYINLPIEKWGEVLQHAPGITPKIIEHLQVTAGVYQQGEFNRLSGNVQKLTGQPPQDIRGWIVEHRELFQAEPAQVA